MQIDFGRQISGSEKNQRDIIPGLEEQRRVEGGMERRESASRAQQQIKGELNGSKLLRKNKFEGQRSTRLHAFSNRFP